eukprot:1160050-Pelagomonas_calceolata.AAC.5
MVGHQKLEPYKTVLKAKRGMVGHQEPESYKTVLLRPREEWLGTKNSSPIKLCFKGQERSDWAPPEKPLEKQQDLEPNALMPGTVVMKQCTEGGKVKKRGENVHSRQARCVPLNT